MPREYYCSPWLLYHIYIYIYIYIGIQESEDVVPLIRNFGMRRGEW